MDDKPRFSEPLQAGLFMLPIICPNSALELPNKLSRVVLYWWVAAGHLLLGLSLALITFSFFLDFYSYVCKNPFTSVSFIIFLVQLSIKTIFNLLC
jgi:nucleoside recognition membrane protein YjiH